MSTLLLVHKYCAPAGQDLIVLVNLCHQVTIKEIAILLIKNKHIDRVLMMEARCDDS